MKFTANLFWGFKDGSLESICYEFCNARTEEYHQVQWEALKKKVAIEVKGERKTRNKSRRIVIAVVCFIFMLSDISAGNVTSATILFVAGLHFMDKAVAR